MSKEKAKKSFKDVFGIGKKTESSTVNDEKSKGAGPKPDGDGAKPEKGSNAKPNEPGARPKPDGDEVKPEKRSNAKPKEPGARPKPDGEEAKPEKQSNAKSKDAPDCGAQPGQNIGLAGGAGPKPDSDGAKPNKLTKEPGAGPKPDGDEAKPEKQSNAKSKDAPDYGAQPGQNIGLAGGAGSNPDGDGAKPEKQSNELTKKPENIQALMERIQDAVQNVAKKGFNDLQTACDRIKDVLPPLVLHEDIDFSSNTFDSYSQSLLPETEAREYLALKTTGDGNCLFRAASILAFGHEGKHEEMRLRTTVELATNSTFYLQDNDNKGRILAQERMYIQSNEEKNVKLDQDTLKAVFENDVVNNASPLAWASDWHVKALGTVLHREIQSVFPECGSAEIRNVYDAFFRPRCYDPNKEPIRIMWTRTEGNTEKDTTPFTPNHFVPLISADKMNRSSIDGSRKNTEENSDESDQGKMSVEGTDKQEKSDGVLRPGVVESRLQTNVLHIPPAVYRTVCIKLNSKDEIFLNDYRMLCDKLGYDETVARGLEQGTTVNRTNQLLWYWSTAHAQKATVEKLINILKEEDFCRLDVVKILDDWVQEGPPSRLSTEVTSLPLDIKREIYLRLDTEDIFYRDYRMLGEKLGFNRDKIEGFKQGKADPTNTLIQKWCKENGPLTVSKLIELLKKERMDVVEVLENWVYGKRGL